MIYCNLSSLLTALDRFNEAEEWSRLALKLQPNLAKGLHGLGVAQSASGKLDEAQVSFKKALKIDPLNSQSMINLASIYSAKLKYNESIFFFKKVIEFNPKSTESIFNLGVCYSELGEMEQALRCFERTLEIDPDNIDAYYAIATSGKKFLSPEQLQILEQLLNSPTISSDKIVKIVKEFNANLAGYACIIDRSNSEVLIKDKIISQIKFNVATYKEHELPGRLKKIQPIKPGSRNLSK